MTIWLLTGTAILFNLYEDKPTFSLSLVLGSRESFGIIPGVSSQLFSSPAVASYFYSDSYKSFLNGLIDWKEGKDRSFYPSLDLFFSWTLGVASLVFFDPTLPDLD